MKKKIIVIILILLMIGALAVEYVYLKNNQKVIYVNVPEETVCEVDKPKSSTKAKITVEEKEQLNTDYHIQNEASKNMQLENTFDSIIQQTIGE